MKTANFKRLTSLILALVLFCSCVLTISPVKSSAATLAEQKAAYNSKIQSAESEIARLRKEKAPQQAVANQLQAQLNDLTNQSYIIQQQRDDVDRQVTSLTAEIQSLNTQIKKTEANLVEMNENIDETVDVFCQRLRVNYMNGPTSYLDVLLNSKDISSMLNQLELMKRVTDSDQKLVDKLNSDIDKAEKLKVKLKSDKNDAELKKTELGVKKVELDASKAEYDKLILSAEAKAEEVSHILYGYNSKIEALHEDVSVYKNEQAKIDKVIKAEEAKRQAALRAAQEATRVTTQKHASSGGSPGGGSAYISTGGSWTWPVPAAYISSYYGYRSDPATGATKFHSGVDLAAASGSSIYATRSGTVHTYYGSTGYGNYILLTHDDGTSSLYGHCSGFAASNGQHVSQGQLIAYVGSTGYSTGPHCHFEIRDSAGNKQNPLNYVHK